MTSPQPNLSQRPISRCRLLQHVNLGGRTHSTLTSSQRDPSVVAFLGITWKVWVGLGLCQSGRPLPGLTQRLWVEEGGPGTRIPAAQEVACQWEVDTVPCVSPEFLCALCQFYC